MTSRENDRSRTPARRSVGLLAALLSLIGALLLAPAPALGTPADTGRPEAAVATVDAATTGVVKTADLSKFQAGNIISDAVFFDSGTMTATQIQQFLQAKVPTCRSGYTCLKDWYDTARTTTADAMCGAYSGGVRERASTIIYKVARACGINPRVLLVMLEKEQGLVSHVWPSEWRYTIAMGQGCPDTAACDTRYYGFFNQVYGAAWQLKRYANPPGTSQFFTWYAPGKTWNIRWHPNAACGSAPVYIQNQATANLYYYTPYQPNAAAIRAGAGVGDSCSSYGNRNFYRYFTDWFGSTRVVPPKLDSLDSSTYLLALDTTGGLWGYPTTTSGVWGDHVLLASGLTKIKKIIANGDFNGDGHRDIIGIDTSNVPWLYTGTGSKLSAATRLPVSWSDARLIAAAGLFNADAHPDVLTVDAKGRLLLWSGTALGGFTGPRVVAEGFGPIDLLTGAVDMTGDGLPDVLGRTTAGNLQLYAGNGSGGIASTRVIGSGWSVMTSVISPGDFTGDGKPDVLATNSAGELVLYPNVGDGSIANGPVVGSGWTVMRDMSNSGPRPSGVRVFAAGAGDANADGAIDVIARTSAGSLLLYPGNGKGGWRTTTTISSKWGKSKFVTIGDFDGDGVTDLAKLAANGDLLFYPGKRTGGYTASKWIGGGWNRFDLVVGGIDFDGDRKLDLIARDPSGVLYLYRGNGAGGWVTGQGQAIGSAWWMFDTVFSIGDFDGNQRAGLVGRRADGTLWLYPMTGTGKWGTPRQIGTSWNGITAVFSPGNFDGKGGPDVLARMPNGDLRLYRGDGKGGWSGVSTIGTAWNGMLQIG
ncbi:VCBS repeat-containing protein [Microbacterium sp. NEAU-LLC]|uniref:VCBS repeat-containing protein n=1 Tax=Microbacterium helvum TaxID=2773713 RepID=A0ABR8NSJ1_9MICO|nr:VCBS repeat-containing protein [Microbacterium helvum]MBD3942011.1 VCBS repeat-containing protein [Microbacterium helvum]